MPRMTKEEAAFINTLENGLISYEQAKKVGKVRLANRMCRKGFLEQQTQERPDGQSSLVFRPPTGGPETAKKDTKKSRAPKSPNPPSPNKGEALKPDMLEVGVQECLCGCGENVKHGKHFRQGHDARLRGIVLRIGRGKLPPSAWRGTDATFEFLKAKAPWCMKAHLDNLVAALDGRKAE